MKMNSSQPGTNISPSEVTNIEALGFWVLVEDKEYFIPFTDYPVFKGASVEQIFRMQQLSPNQLHWPDLDADIEIDALEQPEHYPLVFK
jgi:hypothetical protein